ncbi:PLDc N-terminal domain-containing protein [Methanosarcina sp. Mfa9]|uniref:PLDc N-terminal domain-containing protein n=1 Tax=Methanosarcina sp. Mfa9 TaxID=3439063 RepID=UPI003F830662
MSLLIISLGILSFISLLWVSYDVLTQKKGFSNMLMTIWMIAAVISGVLYAIAFYLFGKGQNKANY